MSNFNLIPFGLHVPSASFKDVGSVRKGVQCDCICPSCKTPLISRQGEVKEWHFAHQSRSTEQETESPCEYSLSVSLRLMIKQLFEEGAEFQLPEYKNPFSLPIPGYSIQYQKTETVCQEAKVQFNEVDIEQKKGEVLFDLMLTKGKHKLYVYITYKGRTFPDKALYFSQQDAIIEFNLITLYKAFAEIKSGQYKELLKTFLASSSEGKRWRSHPRESACAQQLQYYVSANRDVLAEHYGGIKDKVSVTFLPRIEKQTGFIAESQISTQSSEKVSVSTELRAKQLEETKRALHGGLNNRRVLLGSFKASFTKGASAQETVVGKLDSLSPKYLHRCILCSSEWKGESNQCNTCQTHKNTRSVFGL